MAELSVERSNLQRRERLVGYVQLGLGAFCVAWILFRLRHFSRTDLLVLIPIALFVVIAVLHGRLLRASELRAPALSSFMSKGWRGSTVPGREAEPLASASWNHPTPARATSISSGEPRSLNCCARRVPVPGKKRWLDGCSRRRRRTRSAPARQRRSS